MTTKTIRHSDFLRAMGLAARQVGRFALQFRGKVANLEKMVDRTYVNDEQRAAVQALTDVDLAAQEIILLALHDRFPFVEVEPEERTESVALFRRNRSRYRVVIDPIDGTLNYVTCAGQFAVAIGLLRDERFVASAIYFPLADMLLLASRDAGCTVTKSGRTRQARTGRVPAVVFRDSATAEEDARRVAGLGFAVERSGCSIADTTIAATHWAAASIYSVSPSVRRCIGTLVSREAGGYLCDFEGRPYDCEYPSGTGSLLVARDRGTAERILAALGRKP